MPVILENVMPQHVGQTGVLVFYRFLRPSSGTPSRSFDHRLTVRALADRLDSAAATPPMALTKLLDQAKLIRAIAALAGYSSVTRRPGFLVRHCKIRDCGG